MCVLDCKKKLSKVQNNYFLNQKSTKKYKVFFKCRWVAVCVGERDPC